MNKLEAQVIIEDTGNYVEEEIEDVLEVYDEVIKHIGFEDNRRDSRFVVKFHDIFYYTPEEITNTEEFNGIFDLFCNDQYEYICEQAEEEHISVDDMLAQMYCGHYQTFLVYIPEITSENAVDIAMKVYDEFQYGEGKYYVRNYVKMVKTLQDLEDNYMEYWIDFIKVNEYYPEETIKEMEDKYYKDMERRKATQTLAK